VRLETRHAGAVVLLGAGGSRREDGGEQRM
jgi:hypothetical protein